MGSGAEARAERTGVAGAMPNRVLTQDIQWIQTLREDVLLLRFHLARRTDITRMLDATDRLQAESALKSSLAVISAYESNQTLPAGNVSATASALMHAVDRLVHATRPLRPHPQGKYGARSRASAFPNERQIHLESLWRLDGNKAFREKWRGRGVPSFSNIDAGDIGF